MGVAGNLFCKRNYLRILSLKRGIDYGRSLQIHYKIINTYAEIDDQTFKIGENDLSYPSVLLNSHLLIPCFELIYELKQGSESLELFESFLQ